MKTVRILIVALIALGLFGYSQARAGTGVSDKFEPYSMYSGVYSGRPSGPYVAYRARVTVPGAVELRLFFGKVSLGNSSYILIASLEDSSRQHLNSMTISQWNNTTAYFNGNAVEVELHVAPADSHVFFNLDSVLVDTGNVASHGPDRTLTLVNNRTPSDDPAVGRLRDPANGNAEATAWIAANGYLVTAGHVGYLWSTKSNRSEQVLQFDVPNSQSDGTMLDPPAQDQYYIDQWIWYPDSTTLTGDDWGVFSVHPNSETGLYPTQAQQSYYEVEQNDTCSALRVTGYGNAGANSLNDTQQSATGADAGSSGQLLRYSVYISSGSSGSPVIDEYTGKVVGIVDDFGNADYNVGTSLYNPGLWSYMQPKTQTATVAQLLSDNTTTDPNLWRWNGSSFASLSPGSQITVTTGDPEVLKGDQSPDNGQKYNNWTLNGGPDYDVINAHKFLMMGTNFTSHLQPVYNATLESYLTDASSTGFPVSFKDPWLIDYNDPTYGMRNRGMSGAPYESVPIASDNLGTGSSHQGVFLNQSSAPLWKPPYYSVAAPATESYNGHTWAFWHWSGTDSTYFENPTSDTTAVVFGGDGSTVSANYKGLQLSTDPTAYSDNSQRKMIQTPNGYIFETYTDYGHVWLEYSSNNGSSWALANNGEPLDYNFVNGTESSSKCPSLDYDPLTNDVIVVFQIPNGATYSIDFNVFYPSGSSYLPADDRPYSVYTEGTDSYSVNANPDFAFYDGYWVIVFERKSVYGNLKPGLNYLFGTFNGALQPSGPIYSMWGTDGASTKASIYGAKTQPAWTTDVAWQEGSGNSSTIRYAAISFNLGTMDTAGQSVPNTISNSAWPSNYQPSLVQKPDNTAWVCWIANNFGRPPLNITLFSKDPSSSSYNTIDYNESSVSVNLPNGSSTPYIAFSQASASNSWTDYACNYNASSMIALSTTGRDMQLSNGAATDSMYASSFNPSSSPYPLQTSGNIGLAKSTPIQMEYWRGGTINDGSLNFYYSFGNLMVDGRSIDFIRASDSVDYDSLDNLNKSLVTEPFQVTASSRIVFSEYCGFADSTAAAAALGDSGYVEYRAEIIDNSTGVALGTVKDVKFTSSNVSGYSSGAYLLNTDGIANKAVQVKITMSTNLKSPEFALIRSYTQIDSSMTENAQALSLQPITVIKDYALDQNYPNPFNPTTVISYTIPKAGHVSLKIYDVLGREVETLVNDNQNVGRYEVNFDGSRLASGVYFYRLVAGSHVITKKMLLIK